MRRCARPLAVPVRYKCTMAGTSRGKSGVHCLVAALALNVGLVPSVARAEPPAAPTTASADASSTVATPSAGATSLETTPRPPAKRDDSRPPPPRPEGTPEWAMHEWFDGEQQESTAFQVVGLGSIAGGAILLSHDGDAADAGGITFLAMGGLVTLFSVSYALPLATTRDRLQADFERDAEGTRQKELQRARGIADRFVMYRWGEIVIAAAGVGLVAGGAIADEGVPLGIGAGLATEGGLALFLDSFGERRVATYIKRLEAGGAPAPRALSSAPPIGLAITPQGFAAGYRAEF